MVVGLSVTAVQQDKSSQDKKLIGSPHAYSDRKPSNSSVQLKIYQKLVSDSRTETNINERNSNAPMDNANSEMNYNRNTSKPLAKEPFIIIQRGDEEFWTLFILHNHISNRDEIIFTNKNWLKFIQNHSNDTFRLIKRYLNGRAEPPDLDKLVKFNLTDEEVESIEAIASLNCDHNAS